MLTLNQTQFAKHIGVHKSYITELKQAGRIVMAENGKVDVEASMLLITETSDPNRDDVSARHAKERGQDTKVDEIGETKPEKISKKLKPVIVHDAHHSKFSEGRAKEQHFKALAAELEYQKNIGEVVQKADMQMAVADVVTRFRQRLENLPHSISAELVGQSQDEIHVRIKHECHDILSELAREFAAKIDIKAQESI
jgi:hypothetical protein